MTKEETANRIEVLTALLIDGHEAITARADAACRHFLRNGTKSYLAKQAVKDTTSLLRQQRARLGAVTVELSYLLGDDK